MHIEEGDWKIPQGRGPPGDILHGRAEAKFIYINNRLGSYAKKGDLAFRLTITEGNFTLKVGGPGLNKRSIKD